MIYTIKYLLARFWKNLGPVTNNIYRSGQMGSIHLPITNKILKIKYIIALNMDGSNKEEEFEKEYCKKKKIEVLHYNWAASSNIYPEELQKVIDVLEYNNKNNIKTLIHCAGGRDRTGGAIGCWMMRGESYKHKEGILETFFEECKLHKLPAEGWLDAVIEEYNTKKKNAQKINKYISGIKEITNKYSTMNLHNHDWELNY